MRIPTQLVDVVTKTAAGNPVVKKFPANSNTARKFASKKRERVVWSNGTYRKPTGL